MAFDIKYKGKELKYSANKYFEIYRSRNIKQKTGATCKYK
jgi:hypothetical protein